MKSKLSLKRLRLVAFIVAGFVISSSGSAFGAVTFGLFESGTSNNSLSVLPGGSFSMDVVALGITTEGFTQPNLDSFTYRVIFPNENFTLTDNLFASPFDNTQVPTGFNGSKPWYTGTSIPITNGADAGSPGTTLSESDLYRTTASTTGTPATGTMVLLETIGLLAPTAIGDYIISLNVLEAADTLGEFHTPLGDPSLNVSVVPIPSTLGLLLPGFAGLVLLRQRGRFFWFNS